jgi:hypothetical protein
LLLISATGAGAPPVVAAGAYDAVAVGTGAVAPALDGVTARWTVVQATDGAAPPARGLVLAAGAGAWRTARDGGLTLDCDDTGCRQAGG